MMATTHTLAGIAVALVVAVALPEFAAVLIIAAIIGGFFPDLDLYAGHRRTLHYPVYYPVATVASVVLAVVVPTVITIGLAMFFLAATIHTTMDIFGGGLELKPWLARSERAVYDHYHDRWIRPRRWVRYDGSPEDFLLGLGLAVPALALASGWLRDLILVLVAVSLGYTLVRKPLASVTEWLMPRVPEPVLAHLPQRFLPFEEEYREQFIPQSGNP